VSTALNNLREMIFAGLIALACTVVGRKVRLHLRHRHRHHRRRPHAGHRRR
jgi:hypothetical protein